MFFCADKRAQLKKEQPDLKVRAMRHEVFQQSPFVLLDSLIACPRIMQISMHDLTLLTLVVSQITEVAQVLGGQWKELDDKGKAKYVAQAEKDKERYAKEMASYKP